MILGEIRYDTSGFRREPMFLSADGAEANSKSNDSIAGLIESEGAIGGLSAYSRESSDSVLPAPGEGAGIRPRVRTPRPGSRR